MISTRYVPIICVLVAVALVPTVIHSYSNRAFDDGRRAAALPEQLSDYESTLSSRGAGWGRRRFTSEDWVERIYTRPGSVPVTVTVVRSLDAKSVYHHPELAVAYGTSFLREDVRSLPARPEMPVHVLKPSPGTDAIGLYVLHYDDRFVDNPIVFQIRTAGELLFSRRRPMTLVFVQTARGTSLSDSFTDDELQATPAAQLLFAAVDAFVKQSPAQ